MPIEPIRIERHPRLRERVQSPRRDGFFVLIWIAQGRGTYTIDFLRYSVRPGALFLIVPGQVHAWTCSSDVQGVAIPFEEAFLHAQGQQTLLALLRERSLLGEATTTVLPPHGRSRVSALVASMLHEFDARLPGYSEMMGALLVQLLVIAHRSVNPQSRAGPLTGTQALVRRFLSLASREPRADRALRHFAADLGVSAGHLGDCVREVMGQSAGAVLRQHVLLEAKRLLAQTDLSASQVAHQLHFRDAAYFSRFFRRETKRTPLQFRVECNNSQRPANARRC